MKKLIVFDLDGTLAESKSSLDAKMSALLHDLLGIVKVAVISGGGWPQFEKQLLSNLPHDPYLANLSLLPTCGTKFFQYAGDWIRLYSEDFTPEEMEGAKKLQANDLSTSFFEFGTNGKFHEKTLPIQAQFSPVFTITPLDYDKDGNMDLLLCGNINQARLRFGKSDANYGILLKGDGKGNFQYINQVESGFHIRGDVRSVLTINNDLLFGINQKTMETYKLGKHSK